MVNEINGDVNGNILIFMQNRLQFVRREMTFYYFKGEKALS
jgi:hypothetical protein